jgi:hypothetical protein
MIIAYPKAKRKTQFVNITRILRNTNLSKEVTAMKKLSYLYCILCFGFLLGIHDGRIALWKGDDPEPVKVFPYFASLLRKQIRELCKRAFIWTKMRIFGNFWKIIFPECIFPLILRWPSVKIKT